MNVSERAELGPNIDQTVLCGAQDAENAALPRWYAVQTRSRFEQVVRSGLASRDIEQYLPTFQEVHQWKDRKKIVELPLFPGYVFARFANTDGARIRVLSATGVVRVLGTAGAIEPIPEREMVSIRRLLASGRGYYPCPFTREGSWVRIRRGVLAGLEGRLERIKSQTRLILSITLLSQSVATEVDARDVEFVPDRPAKLQS